MEPEAQSQKGLSDSFDCVVMLTWSDWFKEPRSNRYHYATRFARHLPVLFVQQNEASGAPDLVVLPTEHNLIDVVQLSLARGEESQVELEELLRARGLRKPLLWIYNPRDYRTFIQRHHNALRVFHATEDFLTPSDAWDQSQQEIAEVIREHVRKLLHDVDVLVAVSSALAETYRASGAFAGRIVVARNGCDAAFFRRIAESARSQYRRAERPIAVYQGGINRRVDFDLLHGVIHLLPEWDFWFCGRADGSLEAWDILLSLPNVRYFGEVGPEQMAELLCSATVGLIPFRQIPLMRDSLPLKAFEYVACGLPVVTTPIAALNEYPDIFSVAHSAEEFARAMHVAQVKRRDQAWLDSSRLVADENSYDRRFAEVVSALTEKRSSLSRRLGKLNVLIFYDDRWSHIRTILEHVDAFRKYSRHQIYLVPASGSVAPGVDLDLFDVVIHHYAVRLSLAAYMNERLARKLADFSGLKILFIQDEYDTTETARCWIERLRFDIVYTCVPEQGRETVYPSYRFPWIDFLPTLTGYVPEVDDLDGFARPIAERSVRIGYRGRILSYFYGKLGYEKFRIGVDVRRFAQERGVSVDIEVDDRFRIYGADWYRFLGSVRATLGTESGANIFDFDGFVSADVRQYLIEKPKATFEEVFENVLKPHEDMVRMNQISPKVFEAIRLRTGLVLFEGTYSGVIEPDRHFIQLKKDYSNIDDVFRKLEDVHYLEQLTERAFADIVGSGRYSYSAFVRQVDLDIEQRVLRGKYELYSTPALARCANEVRVVLPQHPLDYGVSTAVMYGEFQREQLAAILTPWVSPPPRLDPSPLLDRLPLVDPPVTRQLDAPYQLRPSENVTPPETRSLAGRIARSVWRMLPVGLRTRARVGAVNLVERARRADKLESSALERVVRAIWRRTVPESVRHRVLSALKHG